jgi:signal peptidase I
MRELYHRLRANPIIDLAITLAVAIAIAYVVQLWVVKPFQIPSQSMERTFHVHDRIIAARFLYHFTDPARGDIMVFHPNGQGSQAFRSNQVASVVFVKRLIGMPGEWIYGSGGKVHVCSRSATSGCRALDEPYVSSRQDDFSPVHIPPGQYFMMGDNRSNSDDSRIWGTIKRSQILGRVFATYWPPTRISVY